tara:strand:+ start:58 stop:177 length:120 start_codon:yes stop_codon:yes gene_type:complete
VNFGVELFLVNIAKLSSYVATMTLPSDEIDVVLASSEPD